MKRAAIVAVLLAGCSSNKSGTPDGGAGDVCTTGAQCASGFVCAAGHCTLEGSVGQGGPCSATRDCATGLYCAETGTCETAGSGVLGSACSSTADCARGLYCELEGFVGTCSVAGTGDLGSACTATGDCLAGLVCGADGQCDGAATAYPPFAGVACGADETPFRVYWQVPRPTTRLADFFRLPFPNDARVNDDGTLDLSDFPRPGPGLLGVDLVALYADALAQDFDGFSTMAPVTFRFSSELDFSTLGQNGANLHYVDITDPASTQFGVDRPRNYGYDTAKHTYLCQNALTVGNTPDDPLAPGHTYAVYVTTAILSTSGSHPTIEPDLAAVLADTQPSDAVLAKVWTRYANFRTMLQKQAIAASTIAGVAVFTVQDPTAKARALAAATLATGVPALSDLTLCNGASTPSPCASDTQRQCGDASPDFYEIQGKLTEPRGQQGTEPYETPADGGAILWNGATPVQNGTEDVCFDLTIPKGKTMPAGGWPLVVHAHGTGGSFKDGIANGVAGALATATTPMATLTFDGVAHGLRRGASTRSPDSLVFNVVNPRAARDNHQQGAMDVIEALRVAQVAQFSVTGVGAIKLDPTRTYFFGHSQGSNVGIPGVALSPDAKAAIFSGAGSDLVAGILEKKSPVDAKAGLSLLLSDNDLGGGEPVMILWQTFFDRVDPINYDRLVVTKPPTGVPSKHVFMTWTGIDPSVMPHRSIDSFSPSDTLSLTAAVMGLAEATPLPASTSTEQITQIVELLTDARPVSNDKVGGDGLARTAAVFPYATGGAYDGHFVAFQSPAAVTDWKAFLTSLAATGTPNVP